MCKGVLQVLQLRIVVLSSHRLLTVWCVRAVMRDLFQPELLKPICSDRWRSISQCLFLQHLLQCHGRTLGGSVWEVKLTYFSLTCDSMTLAYRNGKSWLHSVALLPKCAYSNTAASIKCKAEKTVPFVSTEVSFTMEQEGLSETRAFHTKQKHNESFLTTPPLGWECLWSIRPEMKSLPFIRSHWQGDTYCCIQSKDCEQMVHLKPPLLSQGPWPVKQTGIVSSKTNNYITILSEIYFFFLMQAQNINAPVLSIPFK